jgi:hypothetical protein
MARRKFKAAEEDKIELPGNDGNTGAPGDPGAALVAGEGRNETPTARKTTFDVQNRSEDCEYRWFRADRTDFAALGEQGWHAVDYDGNQTAFPADTSDYPTELQQHGDLVLAARKAQVEHTESDDGDSDEQNG